MKTVHCQRGIAAVETALLIAATMVLLPILLYLGRLTYHAIVLDKATYEAVRIVAALPEETYAAVSAAGTMRTLVVNYIDEAARENGLDTRPLPESTSLLCDIYVCGSGKPATVSISTWATFSNAGLQPPADSGIDLPDARLAPAYTVSYAP